MSVVGTGTVELIMFPGIWSEQSDPEALDQEYFTEEEENTSEIEK